jgi:hypothetical protein
MEVVIIAVILGLIPGMIAEKKGHSGVGWWLFGSLLFIVALPAALLLSTRPEAIAKERVAEGRFPCPSCSEFILPSVKICHFCKSPV